MSKELKMLLISIFLLIGTVVITYLTQNYQCDKVEYQDLNGTHTKTECHKKKAETCWDKYATEQLAIQQCEGK